MYQFTSQFLVKSQEILDRNRMIYKILNYGMFLSVSLCVAVVRYCFTPMVNSYGHVWMEGLTP